MQVLKLRPTLFEGDAGSDGQADDILKLARVCASRPTLSFRKTLSVALFSRWWAAARQEEGDLAHGTQAIVGSVGQADVALNPPPVLTARPTKD